MIWFSSDQHFGHKGVIEFCNRPWKDVERMDAGLIGYWNSQIKDTDQVYVVGDFSFHTASKTAEIAKTLNGKKILVAGNHDKHSRTQYLEMGFSDVFDEVVLHLFGKRLRVCHFPYWPQNIEGQPKHDLRYRILRPKPDPEEFLICGHVHKAWKILERQINVSVDAWNYLPVSLGTIEKEVAKILKSDGNQPAQN